jgi:tRNA nucleotidyltransferase (CCA-adding enzyme)
MEIARTLEDAGFEAWCVGGNLRDQLLGLPTAEHRDSLGHPHSDYDIATSARPEQVQKLFPRTVAVGIKYGTVGVLDRKRELHEVTTFRRDVTTDGRHAVVAYGVALEEDLARRDFTINAIAYHPIRREWRDPFAGAADLDRGLVRAVGDPAERFREDYLRILRAVRFAARFGFAIDPATWEAARALSPGLTQLSAERVREEWFKGLRTALSVMQLATLWRSVGAAQVWIPELESEAGELAIPEPPLDHRDPVLLTALLSRNPAAILRRLKASNAEIERATGIERGPGGPAGNDPRSVRHWLAGVGAAADDLSILWRLRRGKEPPWAATVQSIRANRDPLARSSLAITGADLQAMGLSGPRVGQVLGKLLEQVLDEPALNTRDALLALARELA